MNGSVADEPATARARAGHGLPALDADLPDNAGFAAAGYRSREVVLPMRYGRCGVGLVDHDGDAPMRRSSVSSRSLVRR
jgi:hypothetical protein